MDTGCGMADSMFSVTLTGKVRGGRDAPAVWERVAKLLKLEAGDFRERVLARVPVTLKAVDYEAARRQLEALTSGGADALMLAEDAAPRVWVREAQRTFGPLSMAFARHALREGMLPAEAPACLQGSKAWQALKGLVERHPPPAAPASPAIERPEARTRAKARRSRRRRPSGRSSAVLVIVASLVLLGTLAVLVGWPAYRATQVRMQVQQAIARTAPARSAVAAYFAAHGRFPVDAAAAGVPADGQPGTGPAEQVTVDRGEIRLVFGATARAGLRGRHVRLTPAWQAGRVTWRCRSTDLPQDALPATCR